MTTSRSFDCPACGTAFEQRVEHGITIDHCENCGGVWLDPGELEQLTDHKHSHHRDIDIDVEEEGEAEEEGGILGTIAGALGGGDEEFEEQDEFGMDEGFEEEDEF